MMSRPKLAPALSLAVLALLAGAGSASAQSCGSEVERLARQYDLSASPVRQDARESGAAPTGAPGSGTTTTARRAEGAGVTAPSDTGTPAAIQPGRPDPDRAAAPPERAPPEAGAPGAAALTAGDRARMESLLRAAAAAERQGKADDCLAHLREAQAVPGARRAE